MWCELSASTVPHRLREEAVRLGILLDDLDHVRHRGGEVELTTVAHLSERGRHAAPVQQCGSLDDGEAAGLQVQPPDPRAILGGEQSVGERGKPLVEDAAVEQPCPRVRVVDHGLLVGGEDRVARRCHHSSPRMRCSDELAILTRDAHVVGADEVAIQLLQLLGEDLQPARLHPVVTVDEAERVALDVGEPLIPRGGETARARIDEDLGVREALGVRAHDVAGAVARSVVDRDELERTGIVELPQQGLERRADVGLCILRGEDRGDERAVHGFGCCHPHVNAR